MGEVTSQSLVIHFPARDARDSILCGSRDASRVIAGPWTSLFTLPALLLTALHQLELVIPDPSLDAKYHGIKTAGLCPGT